MKIVYLENLQKILKNKNKLEKQLKVKIEIKKGKKEISISGLPEDEYIAEKVLDALSFGFPISTAMLIKKEDFVFELSLIHI